VESARHEHRFILETRTPVAHCHLFIPHNR